MSRQITIFIILFIINEEGKVYSLEEGEGKTIVLWTNSFYEVI